MINPARLSGGDIWLDVVIDNYTRRAVAYDFAVGGNTVNSSRVQAGPFSAGPPIYDFTDQHAEFESVSNQIRWNRYNSIFISWFGINDVAVQVYRGRSFDEAQSLLLPDIGDYFRLLRRQYRIGARKFITVLVPRKSSISLLDDFGIANAPLTAINRAPVFGYGTAANAPDVDQVLQYWNQNMKQEHDKFRRRHPFADARIVDPTDLFNRILNDPETYGAPNSSCFNFPEGQPCLWHDFIHPGIVIQAELGNLIGRVVRSMNRFLG